MSKFDTESVITEGWDKTENELETSFTQRSKKVDEALKKIFPDDSEFENWALNSKEAMVQGFEAMNLTDAEQQKVSQAMRDALSPFSGEIQSKVADVLSQIDLNDGFSSLLANKQSFVDKLKEVGLDANEAAKAYSKYITDGTNAIISALTNVNALKVSFKNFSEGLKTSLESNKDLVEAFTKWGSDDLDLDSLSTLFQNAWDSVSFDKNGKLNIDMKQAPKDLANNMVKNAKSYVTELAKAPQYAAAFDKGKQSNYDEILKAYKLSGETDTAKFIDSNAEKLKRLNLDAGVVKSFLDSGEKDAKTYREHLQESIDESGKYVSATAAEVEQGLKDMYGDAEKAQENYDKAVRDYDKSKRNLKKAIRDEQKAHDDLADAIKKEQEAYEDLQEAYEGSKFYDSNIEDLYNYEQRLTSLTKKMEQASSLIDDSTDISESTAAWEDYASAVHDTLVVTEARNELNKKLAAEGTEFLTKNYGQYFSVDDYGKLTPDISFLESAKMPDAEKDFIGEQIQKVNEYVDAVKDGEKEVYDTRRQYQDKLKELYKNYVSLEDNIAEVLKKQAEEEVNTQKDKYDKLKEADNDYLDALQDAIDKQRKLRDTENQYEELAQKQKKLSLMQRDTSGARDKDALELEKEIQDDQQNLLDNAVDNMIDNMKSLQETQQELRETEVELKEAIIDDTNWAKEAAEILKTFNTADDYVGWMAANDPDFADMSVNGQEVQMMEWEDQGKQLVSYLSSQTEAVTNAVTTTGDEILNIVNNTSEGATGAIERDSAKVQKEITDAQTEAEQALRDAQNAVADAKEAIEDAKDAVADARQEVNDNKDAVDAAKNALDLANTELSELDPVFANFNQYLQDFYNTLVKLNEELGKTEGTGYTAS